MKLKDTFLIHESQNESILIDSSGENFSGFVRTNPTSAFIIECLKEDTTEEKIADKMLDRYEGVTRDIVMKDIVKIVEKLKSIGAIDE